MYCTINTSEAVVTACVCVCRTLLPSLLAADGDIDRIAQVFIDNVCDCSAVRVSNVLRQ